MALAEHLGSSVTGVGCSVTALRRGVARRDAGVRYVAGDALQLPIATARFLGALILDSLAAIPDRAALLGELARVLGDGGRLGCSVEADEPLGAAELATMAARGEADVLPRSVIRGLFEDASLPPLQLDDRTASHAGMTGRPLDPLQANRPRSSTSWARRLSTA